MVVKTSEGQTQVTFEPNFVIVIMVKVHKVQNNSQNTSQIGSHSVCVTESYWTPESNKKRYFHSFCNFTILYLAIHLQKTERKLEHTSFSVDVKCGFFPSLFQLENENVTQIYCIRLSPKDRNRDEACHLPVLSQRCPEGVQDLGFLGTG